MAFASGLALNKSQSALTPTPHPRSSFARSDPARGRGEEMRLRHSGDLDLITTCLWAMSRPRKRRHSPPPCGEGSGWGSTSAANMFDLRSADLAYDSKRQCGYRTTELEHE